MTKFYEELNDTEKEKYIKDIKRSIDLEKYSKIKEFILNNTLYITNIKTNPIEYDKNKIIVIIDNSINRWFILSIDGKIALLAKKNVIIHTDCFKYTKRNSSFNKNYKIKKVNYLVEYIENIGANLTLNLSNYNDKIGKEKWQNENQEIAKMTLHSQLNSDLNGFTYNSTDFSLCCVGKNYIKELDILK